MKGAAVRLPREGASTFVTIPPVNRGHRLSDQSQQVQG